MDHGDSTRCPTQPFSREQGALVLVDADGNELRMHEHAGRWHARRWRVSPIHGQWIGPQVGLGAKELTPSEWRTCAAALPAPESNERSRTG